MKCLLGVIGVLHITSRVGGCLEDLCRLSDSLTSLIHMYEYMILTDYFIEKHWLIFYSEAVAHLKACMQQQV